MTRRRFVLIGHPVAHSVSPAIHQAAYRSLSRLDCEYVAVDCPDEASVRRQLDAIRSGVVAGANVTVPWKRLALSLADDADVLSTDTGAANVLTRRAGSVVAYNTDVGALKAELDEGATGRGRAVVLGGGGAALASVVACRSLGVREICVTTRKWEPTASARDWPRAAEFARLGAVAVAWDFARDGAATAALRQADIIVQATSAGMEGVGGGAVLARAIPWTNLRRDVFVYDLVYNPPETAVLAAARRIGVPHSGGLGMLVRQAALALELWLGQTPPLAPLHDAAERALFGGA